MVRRLATTGFCQTISQKILMRCPNCQHEFPLSDSPALPFCSERCRNIDLGRWLGESYGLQVLPDPEADELPQDDWAQDRQSHFPSDRAS